MNNKRRLIAPGMWAKLSDRARRHLISIMIIERLEAVERQATAEQFAAAARIAARAISQARSLASRRQL
ncbi:MAG: hypothetical protein ACM3JC_09340 [Rudaea sp.]